MECPSCNRENIDDAKFCSGCGINFEEILKCVDCDAELASDDSFCSACGKPIEDSSEPEPEPTPSESAPQVEPIHTHDEPIFDIANTARKTDSRGAAQNISKSPVWKTALTIVIYFLVVGFLLTFIDRILLGNFIDDSFKGGVGIFAIIIAVFLGYRYRRGTPKEGILESFKSKTREQKILWLRRFLGIAIAIIILVALFNNVSTGS